MKEESTIIKTDKHMNKINKISRQRDNQKCYLDGNKNDNNENTRKTDITVID